MAIPASNECPVFEAGEFDFFQLIEDHCPDVTTTDTDARRVVTTHTPMSSDSDMDVPHSDDFRGNQMTLPFPAEHGIAFTPQTEQLTPFFGSGMNIEYEPLRHEIIGHRRSVSVPPEDMMSEQPQAPMVFHRGGTFLGDSFATPKNLNRGSSKKKSHQKIQSGQLRHSPYPSAASSPTARVGMRRTQTAQPAFAGPTSAPSMPTPLPDPHGYGDFDEMSWMPYHHSGNHQTHLPQSRQPGAPSTKTAKPVTTGVDDPDDLRFGGQEITNTAVLGMFGYANRLMRDCEDMRDFLQRGFKDSETGDGEVERYVPSLPQRKLVD